jgi:hypothetical protein
MQIVGILLLLLNIGTIAAPMAGVAIVYQDHIQDVIIPPQLTDMINNTISLGADPTTLVKFVAADFNNVTRTVTLTVDFSNPLDYTLRLKSLTADVQCAAHDFILGQFNLVYPIDLPGEQTTQVTLSCFWTENAENHYRIQHSGETTIDIELMYFTANVNDITMQLTEPISVPDVPIV